MDEMAMRLSELESESEELVKQTGRLSAQQERDHALLQKMVSAMDVLHETQKQILSEQEALRNAVHNIQRHLDTLTDRADSIDETADILEDRLSALDETTKVLSSDMDNLYEDMNVLSAETRNRGIKLKEEIQRFLWDSTESKYDEESDTMWQVGRTDNRFSIAVQEPFILSGIDSFQLIVSNRSIILRQL